MGGRGPGQLITVDSRADYFSDLELLADAFLDDHFDQPPANVVDKLMLGNEIFEDLLYQNALDLSFTREWPRHHSRSDAKAMVTGYRAWEAKNKGGQNEC